MLLASRVQLVALSRTMLMAVMLLMQSSSSSSSSSSTQTQRMSRQPAKARKGGPMRSPGRRLTLLMRWRRKR